MSVCAVSNGCFHAALEEVSTHCFMVAKLALLIVQKRGMDDNRIPSVLLLHS